MRRIVLSNYLKSEGLHDVAFAYATPGVFTVFKKEGFATFANTSERAFNVQVADSGIAAPNQVELDRSERNVLVTLYNIEGSMVNAIKSLYKVLSSQSNLAPEAFEKRLGDFGDALIQFDNLDQTTNKDGIGVNTIFVMFDTLVRLAVPEGTANIAVMRLETDAGSKAVEKLFMSDAAVTG
jgi:hypothetical protein